MALWVLKTEEFGAHIEDISLSGFESLHQQSLGDNFGKSLPEIFLSHFPLNRWETLWVWVRDDESNINKLHFQSVDFSRLRSYETGQVVELFLVLDELGPNFDPEVRRGYDSVFEVLCIFIEGEHRLRGVHLGLVNYLLIQIILEAIQCEELVVIQLTGGNHLPKGLHYELCLKEHLSAGVSGHP